MIRQLPDFLFREDIYIFPIFGKERKGSRNSYKKIVNIGIEIIILFFDLSKKYQYKKIILSKI